LWSLLISAMVAVRASARTAAVAVAAVVIHLRMARSAVVNDSLSGSTPAVVAAWVIRCRIAW
jgi:hypothetical protein